MVPKANGSHGALHWALPSYIVRTIKVSIISTLNAKGSACSHSISVIVAVCGWRDALINYWALDFKQEEDMLLSRCESKQLRPT